MKDLSWVLRYIQAHKGSLTRQQLKTLVGQAKAGDLDGAVRGLRKILAAGASPCPTNK